MMEDHCWTKSLSVSKESFTAMNTQSLFINFLGFY